MRISTLATISLFGALAIAPSPSSAQVSITLHLGKPVEVTNYSPQVYGDWHTAYKKWHPVTLYYYEHNWYSKQVKGSRPVMVYRSASGHYFLPPQDHDFYSKDHRYNSQRRPSDDDYVNVPPPHPLPPSHRPG